MVTVSQHSPQCGVALNTAEHEECCQAALDPDSQEIQSLLPLLEELKQTLRIECPNPQSGNMEALRREVTSPRLHNQVARAETKIPGPAC